MVELKTFLSVVVVFCLFGQSLQDDECTLVSWGHSDQDPKPDLVSKCIAGSIAMNYPQGTVNVTFPWSLLPNGTRWARVCFKQTGRGVFSATDITERDNQTMDFGTSIGDPQGAGYLNRFDWVCTKSHRIPTVRPCLSRHLRCKTRSYPIGPKGIRLSLYFGEHMELYLQIIKYKMEEGERPQLSNGKSG
ncbi:hypothetical protein ACJMK2_021646 [Sinanodonta woodiana]|uniref:Uncharacterized protein n=1 Tax=Sinanodonta woodiana TaxID=1069815 RepID=A0ABD3TGP7_SINWO